MSKKLNKSEVIHLYNSIFDIDAHKAKCKANEKLYKEGMPFDKQQFFSVKVPVPSLATFCDAHVSFVWKSRPIIKCSGGLKDQFLATLREKTLNNWWDNYRIYNRIGRALTKATYQNEILMRFVNDKKNKNFYPEFLDENYRVQLEDPNDPFSRCIRIAFHKKYTRKSLERELDGIAKLQEILDKVFTTTKNSRRVEYRMLTELEDEGYHYYMYNGKVIACTETQDWMPAFKFVYFVDGQPLMDRLKHLAFGMQHFLSAQASLVDKQVEMPYLFKGEFKAAKEGGQTIGWQMGERGDATIGTVPMDLGNVGKFVETYKGLMHFASGISEEAMAGFSGALDVATSSIELRMDSTIRGATKIQSNLKPFLERMNRDWIKLMHKHYPNTNLSIYPEIGKIPSLDDYTITDLGENMYENQIGFASIVPRSNTSLQQTILGMKNANLISTVTALNAIGETLDIDDPELEVKRVQTEFTQKDRLNKALEQGIVTVNDPLSPQQEVEYTLKEKSIPDFNFDLIASVDQRPYIEEIDKALSGAHKGNILLLTLKKSHIDIMESQKGPKAEGPENPNEFVQQQDSQLVPSSKLGGANTHPNNTQKPKIPGVGGGGTHPLNTPRS